SRIRRTGTRLAEPDRSVRARSVAPDPPAPSTARRRRATAARRRRPPRSGWWPMSPEAAGPGCRRTARTAQDRRPGTPRRRRAATTSGSCRRAPRAGPAVRAVARRARLPRAPDPYRRRSGSMPPRPPRLFTLAPVDVTEDRRCRLGVLAFGDSITNGGGELQWGVALQSWALWVA